MSNKYCFRSKISERDFRIILKLFCLDLSAKQVSEFIGYNRGTTNKIYNKLRKRIAELCEQSSPFVNGEIELDESYFVARRVRGKRGRGATRPMTG